LPADSTMTAAIATPWANADTPHMRVKRVSHSGAGRSGRTAGMT
jgi:hypothetical protein